MQVTIKLSSHIRRSRMSDLAECSCYYKNISLGDFSADNRGLILVFTPLLIYASSHSKSGRLQPRQARGRVNLEPESERRLL